MRRTVELGLVLCLLAGAPARAAVDAWPAAGSGARPEVVEPLRKKGLSTQRYRELRDAWRAYAAAHPNDGFAWAQVSRAASYAGAECDSSRAYAEWAVRVAPNEPEALAQLARHVWTVWCDGDAAPDAAIRLLERAQALDPTLDDTYIRLWVARLARGGRKAADAELVTMLDRGRIPEPLVDYAYNELVALEPNAVLFTNGDNDTYPAVALQAGRGFRTDVTVINLSMLNLGFYRRMLREPPNPVLAPIDTTPDSIAGGPEAMRAIVDALVRPRGGRPVYFAVTVPTAGSDLAHPLTLEGIVYRVWPGTRHEVIADTTQIERNFGARYRMQSASSRGLDWNEWSALRTMVANYMAAEWALARALAPHDPVAAGRALARGLELAEFHHQDDAAQGMLAFWHSFAPGSRDLKRWAVRLHRND